MISRKNFDQAIFKIYRQVGVRLMKLDSFQKKKEVAVPQTIFIICTSRHPTGFLFLESTGSALIPHCTMPKYLWALLQTDWLRRRCSRPWQNAAGAWNQSLDAYLSDNDTTWRAPESGFSNPEPRLPVIADG